MAYTRVNWENLPSTNTPVNATNLNKTDAGIANAVEKTGDTLTGFLDFNNKNEYHVFTKTRTVNNVDYKTNFGISAAPSTRIEFQDANDNTLGRLDIKSDGIYNGLSNMKLGETVHLTWGNSLSFKLEGGHHALAMINNDCLMLWAAGSPVTLSITRILGTSAQATYNASTQTVTITSGGSNFSGNVLII